jgi:hypothetical protein
LPPYLDVIPVGPSYVVSICVDDVAKSGSEAQLAFHVVNKRQASNRDRFRPAYLFSIDFDPSIIRGTIGTAQSDETLGTIETIGTTGTASQLLTF